MYCLYHANCNDGFGAAHIVWNYYAREGQFIPVLHGQPCPLDTKTLANFDIRQKVMLVDFSYDEETLDKLAEVCDLTVLDHHNSVSDAVKAKPYFTFDNDESGTTLTWKHFYPDKPVPFFYRHLRDMDLWLLEMSGTKELVAALESYPFDFRMWNDFLNSFDTAGMSNLMVEGEAILRFITNQVSIICDNAIHKDVGGHEVPVVNCCVFQSEVGHELCKRYPDKPFSASYFLRGDGQIQCSLRSVGDFDVSGVAKTYGGGGHRNSAGFEQ
jgi:uncharacterized protein